MTKRFSTIIFDMDGLLVDTEVVSHQIYQKLLAKFGHEFSMATYAAEYSGHTESDNVRHLIASYQLPWDFDQTLATVYAIEEELLAQGVELKDGARELLAYLTENGYQIGLATSSVEQRAISLLEQNGVLAHFGQMTFGHEVAHSKPAPDIFLLTAEKWQSSPADCLVLEDSEAGLKAALAAGMSAICIPDMKRPTDDTLAQTLATYDNLHQVIDFLED